MFSVEFGEGIVSKAVPNPFQHNDVSVAVKFSCVKTCQDAQLALGELQSVPQQTQDLAD